MTVFFVIFSVLIALNVLLLAFSSNRSFRAGKSSTLSKSDTASPEALQLSTFDPDYQKAV